MKKSAFALAAMAIALTGLAIPDSADARRNRCVRFNKTTGTVAGAAAGGVIGNVVAGRGNRRAGTLVGAVAGGGAGHVLSTNRPKCRRYARR